MNEILRPMSLGEILDRAAEENDQAGCGFPFKNMGITGAKTAYDDVQEYEFFFPDGQTRRYSLAGEEE
jgi:hypothetical protein